jgi:mannose/fructose/sorbose-specific phosphotransferase system IIB component
VRSWRKRFCGPTEAAGKSRAELEKENDAFVEMSFQSGAAKMEIQLIRIDDRLIHGQVVVGWVKTLKTECLVVVNDVIAANTMQKTLMEMAVPTDLKVYFYTIQEAARAVAAKKENLKSLLLFSNPADVLAFADHGAGLTSINIGGMHFCEGKRQVGKIICVNDEDVKAFRKLKQKGVELEVRAVPGDPKESLENFLPEIKKP